MVKRIVILVLAIALLMPNIARAMPSAQDEFPPEWNAEIVPLPEGTIDVDHSLAVDSAGYPHIAYTEINPLYDNWRLMYAYRDGTGWHFELLDYTTGSPNGTYASSLVLDSNDMPHVSYYDRPNGDLRYAYRQNGEWERFMLDPGDGSSYRAGTNSSIAIDSNDNPHIGYIVWDRDGMYDLKYTYRNIDRQWWTSTAYEYAWYGVSLALTVNDKPKLGYQLSWGDYWVKYFTRSTTWASHTVGKGRGISFATTRHGTYDFSDIHAVFMATDEANYGALAYWQNITGIEIVDPSGSCARLAMDDEKHPHIVYVGSGLLKYAYHDGTDWVIEQLTQSSGPEPEIAIDTQGRAHVIYLDDHVLVYARRGGPTLMSHHIYLPRIVNCQATIRSGHR